MTRIREGAVAARAYQENIAKSILEMGNTLVVLPTGLGKTIVALLVIDKLFDKGRILFLAPTKPLSEQHYTRIREMMDIGEDDVALITGLIPPKKRAELWKKRIVVSTPQTARNDILKGRLSLDHALCIFDEAHRAVGNYAYTSVASECAKAGTLVVGLTASPGGSREKIEGILDALCIKNVEIRTAEDKDVVEYVKPTNISWIMIELSGEIRKMRDLLHSMVLERAEALKKLGFVGRFLSKKHLIEMRKRIEKAGGWRKLVAFSQYASLFNLIHMEELLETQGVGTFRNYVERLRARAQSKAILRILNDGRMKEIMDGIEKCEEHPKLGRVVELVKERPEEKILVFAQYRDQIDKIVGELNKNGIRAHRFVGKKGGVTVKEQKETIEMFRRGEFGTMVCTSIGEEGLDLPLVDTVIFYEPIPSEIRTIQRRGRAGRAKAGNVIVLITKGTRDEAFFWASRKREKKMRSIVETMGKKGAHPEKRKVQKKISEFM